MSYEVRVKKQASKTIGKAPEKVRQLFVELLKDLEDSGPIRSDWPNYSPLSENQYHCHLNYSWVACWSWQKNTVLVEVYYAGSREDAPY